MSGIVVQCYDTGNQGVLRYSFNTYTGHKSNQKIDNQTEVTGFSNTMITYQNGQLECGWQVELTGKVKYHADVYDFDHNKFYIQLATGPYNPSK